MTKLVKRHINGIEKSQPAGETVGISFSFDDEEKGGAIRPRIKRDAAVKGVPNHSATPVVPNRVMRGRTTKYTDIIPGEAGKVVHDLVGGHTIQN